MAKKPSEKEEGVLLEVPAARFEQSTFTIRGKAPYVQNAFSAKAREQMIADQEAGSAKKSKSKKEAKDFDECYEQAIHKSDAGWYGIPAPAFRAAMISACRVAGIVMTRAKLAVFVEADGFDAVSRDPLVKMTKGKPKRVDSPVRLPNGTMDIRPRPMWEPGWEAKVTIRYDRDAISAADVANLLQRAGMQVGIGEGRPDSRKSCGMGWGLFELDNN